LLQCFHAHGRPALLWNIVILPDAQFQASLFAVVSNTPREVWLRILSPVPFCPDNLDITIIKERCLSIVDIHVGIAVADQYATRRRNTLGPAQVQEHAGD